MHINVFHLELVQKLDLEVHWRVSSVDTPKVSLHPIVPYCAMRIPDSKNDEIVVSW